MGELRCTLVCTSADGAAALRADLQAACCERAEQLLWLVTSRGHGWKDGMTVAFEGVTAEDAALTPVLTRPSGHEVLSAGTGPEGAHFAISFGCDVVLGPGAAVTTSVADVETFDLGRIDFLARQAATSPSTSAGARHRFYAAVVRSPHVRRDAVCARIMENKRRMTNAVCLPLTGFFSTVRDFIEECDTGECRSCGGSGWIPLDAAAAESDSEATEVMCDDCAGFGSLKVGPEDIEAFFTGREGSLLAEGNLLRRAVLLARYGGAASAAGFDEAPARRAHTAASLARAELALQHLCPPHLLPRMCDRTVALVAAFAQAAYRVDLRFCGGYFHPRAARRADLALELPAEVDAGVLWRDLATWIRLRWGVELRLG